MRSIEEVPNNPFLPGYPIYPNSFIGRKDDAERILRYLPRVIKQRIPEHFFITGKRGMGKTSFIQYVADIAEKKYDMIPIYINIDGLNTIDDLIANLLEVLFKELIKHHGVKKLLICFTTVLRELILVVLNLHLKKNLILLQISKVISGNF